ncbi:gluconate 2-dehydrogenase subunit 3 family protein [Herbaspirillum sp. RTI4]|uniref:gluconate 2-dehydrogenase subunit 3 family protein n=1 Tax=Herbaspirillum sp. RTI4 TaxID=3048640 RepID=UPI002AB540E0|nr:gluconate 2-dehydrogenase subunit 3 family protein [Herbaspirillum sp. RTI4]MDY7579855.1 gluconate 2-dehydrogenase subunit 3 family protein [Herbaspirillum sp. RTI4]MEA9981942.1 gluconate 2-dehydrogenase subunit 3 family protein [Herbaspirillum sp. RTI4]
MKVIGISPHRRHFLRAAVTAAPAVVLIAAAGVGMATNTPPAGAFKPRYFSPAEWETLSALVDRLIPASDEGPGALEAGAHEFIDLQMNTPYAHGGLWYMQAPFVASAPEFGYQFHMTPRELYRSGLAGLDAAVQKQFSKTFAQLDAAQRDEVISALEKGTFNIGEVPPATFFGQVLQNTKEGYFCDPQHGGNKDMAAWKMIGFPGARADYMDWVEQYGKKYPLPPVSII